MRILHSLAAAAALCLATSTCAQTSQVEPKTPSAGQASSGASGRASVPVQQGQTRQQRFDQLDTNGDGAISRAEAQASPELLLIFVDTDTSGDGAISGTPVK